MAGQAWELQWLILRAPEPPPRPPPPPRGLGEFPKFGVPIGRPSFAGRVDEGVRQKLVEALDEGWEPFDTTLLKNGDVLLWLRRTASAAPQVIEADDLPGQYL